MDELRQVLNFSSWNTLRTVQNNDHNRTILAAIAHATNDLPFKASKYSGVIVQRGRIK
jgi:hypothetical protein